MPDFFNQQQQQQALPWMMQQIPTPTIPQNFVTPQQQGNFVGAGSMDPNADQFSSQVPQTNQQFGSEFGPRPGGDLGGWNGANVNSGQQNGQGNWLNDGTMKGIGSTMQGLGALGGIGLGFMQLKDLRKTREQTQANFEKTYAAQRDSVNEDRKKRNDYRRRMSGSDAYQSKMLA
jgi:hypothetical protein